MRRHSSVNSFDAVAARRAHPLPRARVAHQCRDRTARARAASPGGHDQARSRRRWFTHGTPLGTRVLTTGLPQAIASSCTYPNASARVTDGSTKTSHACRAPRSSSSGTSPAKRTRSPRPELARERHPARRAAARPRRSPRDVDARRARAAGRPRPCRHWRPANSTSGRPLVRESRGARGASPRSASQRAGSMPNGMTRDAIAVRRQRRRRARPAPATTRRSAGRARTHGARQRMRRRARTAARGRTTSLWNQIDQRRPRPRDRERQQRPRIRLVEDDEVGAARGAAATRSAGRDRDRTGCADRADARHRHAVDDLLDRARGRVFATSTRSVDPVCALARQSDSAPAPFRPAPADRTCRRAARASTRSAIARPPRGTAGNRARIQRDDVAPCSRDQLNAAARSMPAVRRARQRAGDRRAARPGAARRIVCVHASMSSERAVVDGVAADLAQRVDVARDHRRAARQRFDHRQAEALALGRQEHERAAPVDGRQRRRDRGTAARRSRPRRRGRARARAVGGERPADAHQPHVGPLLPRPPRRRRAARRSACARSCCRRAAAPTPCRGPSSRAASTSAAGFGLGRSRPDADRSEAPTARPGGRRPPWRRARRASPRVSQATCPARAARPESAASSAEERRPPARRSGCEDRAERVEVVTRDERALGRQRVDEVRVAVIDDVKEVEAAADASRVARG